VVGVIAFGLALALLIVHLVDRSVPAIYAAAAFVAAAVVASADLKEVAGETCVVEDAAKTCTYVYAVKVESLVALVASVAFAMLTLAIYALERLGRAAGGWTT
jgi:hypothetical protein